MPRHLVSPQERSASAKARPRRIVAPERSSIYAVAYGRHQVQAAAIAVIHGVGIAAGTVLRVLDICVANAIALILKADNANRVPNERVRGYICMTIHALNVVVRPHRVFLAYKT